MFELYLDSADVAQIKCLSRCLPLTGITTNPSILARSGRGVNELLEELSEILGDSARFHVQVVSETSTAMLEEARQLQQLPWDIVVKVPATETGLSVIKQLAAENIPVLATAIYSARQGFMAALCGADYLAPYVNRIATTGIDAVKEVDELQQLIQQHDLNCKILAASFKSSQQAMAVIKTGVAAVTLPLDVAEQMFRHSAVDEAVLKFNQDWAGAFGDKRSFES